EARSRGDAELATISENHMRLRKDVRAVYLLEDETGRKITGNIDAMPPVIGPTILNHSFDGQTRQVRAFGYRLTNRNFLLVGQDTATLRQMKALIVRAFSVGFLVTVLLAALGPVIVGTTVLRRLEPVTRTARAIMSGDFSQRAPVGAGNDEF